MVFISYPRKRAAIAHLIKVYLELRGYKTFMDLTELQGGDWSSQLRSAIKKSTDVVVLLVREASPSEAMASEVCLALELNKHIVPVIVDEVESGDKSWIKDVLRYQAVAFDERYPSPSTDALAKLLKTKKGIVSTHETRKFELFQNSLGIAAAALVAGVAFLTNPGADAHMKKIARGPFSEWRLDKDFYYSDYFFWSNLYVVGGDGRIDFSAGLFGKVVELDAFNHNIRRLSNQ